MASETRAQAAVEKVSPPAPDRLLQRKCACGQHAPGGGECEECRRKRTGTLQRAAVRSSGLEEAPPVVHEVLRSPGQALDPAARDFLEPRFGQDFSRVRLRTGGSPGPQGRLAVNRPDDSYEQEADRVAERVTRSAGVFGETASRYDFSGVRVHTDATASASARAVGALAYTVGQDIVFAAGQYAPASPAGRELLAHELTHVVQQEGAGAMVQRRRPRIFGFGFKDEELQEYLENLEKGGIERGPDSDVKAREVLKRRKKFEPLSVQVQALLCEELLVGDSRRDDKAILKLLEAATPGARQEIVKQVGRDRLWAAFEGKRRRAVEVLTLTEDDLKAPELVARLRSLPEAELEQYLATTDPGVKASVDKLLKLQKITTPLPLDTPVDEKGVAHLVYPGFKISILPDAHSGEISKELKAHTEAKPKAASPNARVDSANKILSFGPQPDIEVTIVTQYGPGIFSTSKADYGRGTTPEDRRDKNVNLRFHEGSHGTDILAYLKSHPPPPFPGQTNVDVRGYQLMQLEYKKLVEAYFLELKKATVKQGDCVGIKIRGSGLEEIGLSRTFCSDP